jgi:hypothetical protein
MNADVRAPGVRHGEAMDLDRRVDGEAGGHARRVVEDVEDPVDCGHAGAQHIRVGHVLHVVLRAVSSGLEGKGAAVHGVEEPREDRRAVEAGEAQPVDVGRRRDQRQHAAVADHAVIERWNRHSAS